MYQKIINIRELSHILEQENIVVVDCRFSLADKESGRNAYLKSHIPNAFYAHLDDDLSGEIIAGKTGRHPLPSVEKITNFCSSWGIDSTKQVVVYDDSHGGIAARLWFMLRWLGHENVAVLNGGWKAWTAANLPTNSDIPKAQNADFQSNPNHDLILSAKDIQANIEHPKFTLIDARAAERYRGEVEPIDPIAGHIPTALSFPFLDNLDENHFFISKEKIEKRFASVTDKNLVIYCGSGVTACHNILALTYIGKENVKLYSGSWSEWITFLNEK
jgi:thiosulfate/3-mercaptopyruvate sulfurtransferase